MPETTEIVVTINMEININNFLYCPEPICAL